MPNNQCIFNVPQMYKYSRIYEKIKRAHAILLNLINACGTVFCYFIIFFFFRFYSMFVYVVPHHTQLYTKNIQALGKPYFFLLLFWLIFQTKIINKNNTHTYTVDIRLLLLLLDQICQQPCFSISILLIFQSNYYRFFTLPNINFLL